jgi:hypothetical protein
MGDRLIMAEDLFDLDEGDPQPVSPDAGWDPTSGKRALDELLHLTTQYRSGQDYFELMKFIARFRTYSPFNAMLIHAQKAGSRYVATARRWLDTWRRTIRIGARPMVILQPMGPVMFVFDVNDTEPLRGAPPLPPDIDRPFDVRSGKIRDEYETLVENAKRDGIRVHEVDHGSQSAGSIQTRRGPSAYQQVLAKQLPDRTVAYVEVLVRYELAVNRNLSLEAKYVTLTHELGHLYCGHIGTTNPKWWPSRPGLPLDAKEFEAESAAYLACSRIGIDNPSEQYLAGYVQSGRDIPPISLENVLRSAGLIETMSTQRRMKPRKNSP